MLDAIAVDSAELGDTGIAELDGLAIDAELDAAIVDAAADAADADAADVADDDAPVASDIELEPVDADLAANGFSLTVPGVEQR